MPTLNCLNSLSGPDHDKVTRHQVPEPEQGMPAHAAANPVAAAGVMEVDEALERDLSGFNALAADSVDVSIDRLGSTSNQHFEFSILFVWTTKLIPSSDVIGSESKNRI